MLANKTDRPVDSARSYLVDVPPLPISVYCPGGLIQAGGEEGTEVGKFELVSEATLLLNAPGGVQEDFSEQLGSGQLLTAKDDSAVQSTEVLSALQISSASERRMAGLAGISCNQLFSSGYLLTGASNLGTETIAILSNPNTGESTVTLTELIGGEKLRVVLPAKTQKYINLNQLAGEADKYAIKFEATGPGVSAITQQRAITGLNPIGVELSDAVRKPATQLVFPQLLMLGSLTAPEPELAQAKLRLFNPASESAKVMLGMVSASESKTIQIEVPAGEISEQPLALTDGYWSLLLSSEVPIFAAVMNSTLGSVADFEWLQPAEAIGQKLVIPVPAESKLGLFNPTQDPMELSVNGEQISVAGLARVTVPIPSGILRITGDQIYAAIAVLGERGYAVFEPKDSKNLGANLEVKFR